MELAVAPPDLPRLAVGAARANHDSTQAVDSVFAIARAHCLGNARGDNKLANYLVEAVGCAFCVIRPNVEQQVSCQPWLILCARGNALEQG